MKKKNIIQEIKNKIALKNYKTNKLEKEKIINQEFYEEFNRHNDYYKRRLKEILAKRDNRLLALNGCTITCDCNNELISTCSFVEDCGEGHKNIVKYKCSKCGKELYYNFDIAPAPLRYGKDLLKNYSEEDIHTIMEGRLTSLRLEGNKNEKRKKKNNE